MHAIYALCSIHKYSELSNNFFSYISSLSNHMILPCNLEWIGSRNRKFPLFSRLLQFFYLWKIGSISESGQLILIYFGSILILIWSRNEQSVQLPNLLCAIFLTHNQNHLNYVFDFQKRFCSQILIKIKSGSEIDTVESYMIQRRNILNSWIARMRKSEL